MTVPDRPGAWRKSSFSGQGQDCVEVKIDDESVAIRDTKNRAGGQITLSHEAWKGLLTATQHIMDGRE